ncbi:MAG: VacJ family lipoprotein [bacterium]|nr:MAG: VacJ family lipoprotein [bacterium]KAF0149865.1 MAG: VacJ family lipoprotein [bacterium]KAF0168566.1 MAG: VacJ family lipoprotein [bacterium]TXT19056.1 MAG: VacJ family lipoprotein [bacterium]
MRRYPALTPLLALALAGCAVNGDPRDPLEAINRPIHSFNESFDRYVLKPVARGYAWVLPDFAQSGVRNFFSNLNDVTVLANNILQLKPEQSTRDFLRLAFNSTFGLFGLLDVASEMGLKKNNEDFGQTLGYWGVGAGPYLVLPFLGPGNVRDTAGMVVDTAYTDLVYNYDNLSTRDPTMALRVVSRRADLLDAKRALDVAALDGYEFTRDLYLERRRSLVHDGNPPPLDE